MRLAAALLVGTLAREGTRWLVCSDPAFVAGDAAVFFEDATERAMSWVIEDGASLDR